ncbi:MAG: pirin family protein [Nannocystaceae bacterium]|nr:pirin family protein [Nannocystaceae bacterium]
MNKGIRAIESVHAGRPLRGGDINQMFDGDLRERLKPFVFLDHFDVETDKEWGFHYHPHSGVATFTYTQTADLKHVDTGGHAGVLEKGSVQWMAAGGGIWHEELYQPSGGTVKGLQLWLTLPPELENAAVEYDQAAGSALPVVDQTRVLSGTFGEASSPIRTAYPFNYFDVSADRAWTFDPPADHDVIWLYTYEGAAIIGGKKVKPKHLVVFERGPGSIEVLPDGDQVGFVIGTAAASTHPLVVGQFSMHTNEVALAKGLKRIGELREVLQNAGKL